MNRHTVFACESHPVVVEGLARLLAEHSDLEFLGSAPTFVQASSTLASTPADVVLVDQSAGFRAVLQFLQEMKRIAPAAYPVLWMSTLEGVDWSRALHHGARGILQKTSGVQQILDCIRTVAKGNLWMEQVVSLQMTGLFERKSGPRLTPREREIVHLVCRGMRNRQIAEQLGITPGTVKVHLMHIFEKTGAKNRFELAMGGRQLLGPEWDERPRSQAAGAE
jgi:two-component system nitrate/nitrite response regulator NarL